MIGGFRNTAELRAATCKAAQRLQAQLEREMHERKLPIPFIRNGVLYRRSAEGTVAISNYTSRRSKSVPRGPLTAGRAHCKCDQRE